MPPTDEQSDQTGRASLDARIDDFEAQRQPPRPAEMSAYGAAMRVSADLIAGVLVCAALAYGLSWLWPEHRTILLVFGGVLGIGIGLYNAYRAADQMFGGRPQQNHDEAEGRHQ